MFLIRCKLFLCVYMALRIYGTPTLCISYVTFRRSKRSTFRCSKRSTFRCSKRSTFRCSKRTPDPNSPQISNKVSHVCLCNYVLNNGTGHNKIGKYPALGWSKRKMYKTFLMPGCLRKWMLEKVESFMIFSSCTKSMFCQAGPNLPEHEEHSPWNARHGKPNPTKPWEACEGVKVRGVTACLYLCVYVCLCIFIVDIVLVVCLRGTM